MLNKFALVILTLQLARAERHAAVQSGPRGLAMKSADGCEAVGTCKKQSDSACSNALGTAGCATCTGTGDAQTCLTCKDSAHFIQLDKKGCTSSCTGDGVIGDSAVTPKVCKCDSTNGYTLQSDGTCKKQSNNTNRGSLSTGAIAGISVAVIVIVGGLVGFLCWWFLCRGKA
ncbi:ATPase involved in DNA repair/chromosome segregation [Giardia duodenalis]|uniref:ATPase involved in DNA repair/chromosome segregation n=1 Tax=Giardia intestinalis TaxID=5741 RepID=V6TKV3_GIAIN|nr:ATPase involved in DNA repair/chromosome segregation [Giardia intestinalis]